MKLKLNRYCTKRWNSPSSSSAAAAVAVATVVGVVAVSSPFRGSGTPQGCDDENENDDPKSNREEIWIRTTASITASMTTRCDTSNSISRRKPQQFPAERSPFFGLSPTMPLRYIQPNDNLEICYDTRTKTPLYVLERLTAESLLPMDGGWRQRRRRPNFFQDTVAVPEPNFRSTARHFKGSGYDRGHLAPAADFQADPQHHQDTFSLCNVVPQNHIMNVTIWNSLEEWTRRVCREKTTSEKADTVTADSGEDADKNSNIEMFVVTGPLWLPKRRRLDINDQTFQYEYNGIGQPPGPLISVPTHLFKVVVLVDMTHEVITEFACFVVPNYDDSDNDNAYTHSHDQKPVNTTNKKKQKKTRLEDFLVCWSDLETVSGLQLFPSFTSTPGWKEYADGIVRQQLYLRNVRNNHENGSGKDKPHVLLPLLSVTSSDVNNTISKAKRNKSRNNNAIVKSLSHLCFDGKCQ